MRDDAGSASAHLRVTPAGTIPVDDMIVLAVSGELDAASAPYLRRRVLAEVGLYRVGTVLDLAGMTLVSAAGVRALAATAATLADTGRRLLIARSTPSVWQVVRQAGPALAVVDHSSVSAALDAYRAEHAGRTEPGDGPEEGLRLLRQRARDLPATLRSRPLVAGAIEELRKRYVLRDAETAFRLLRGCSQRYNVKLRALALAFLSAPAVPPQRRMWFTGRRREQAPPITFTSPSRPSSSGALLAAVLDTTLSIIDSEAGYVQITDRFLGGLRLASQRGLPSDTERSFDYIDDAEDASAAAFDSGQETTRTLREEPDSTPPSPLGAVGLCSVHSVPLTCAGHPTMGVVSTLHRPPAPRTSRGRTAALDVVATESAAWLHWHQRTIVPDALEALHRAARSEAGR
jgi:anti-anti-sigma factor